MPSKKTFLCVINYGMGGVWFQVHARTEEEIASRFPELEIVDSHPSWLDGDRLEEMMSRILELDVDCDPPEWYKNPEKFARNHLASRNRK